MSLCFPAVLVYISMRSPAHERKDAYLYHHGLLLPG